MKRIMVNNEVDLKLAKQEIAVMVREGRRIERRGMEEGRGGEWRRGGEGRRMEEGRGEEGNGGGEGRE